MEHGGARPLAAPRFSFGGWTLIELVVLMVAAGVLALFAVRMFQPKEALALEQAERLRNDIRHMQMLALTWGQSLRLTTAANSYSVGCVTVSGTAPCDVTPVVDPATGKAYSVTLESGLGLTGPGFSLDFDSLGRPRNAGALTTGNATFSITGASAARSVVVAPFTGFATAQ
jgi:MSHA pilin protein MshC